MEKKFVNVLEKICGGLLALMVSLLFLQVGTRYIFRGHLLWAGEMAIWLFVWISFLGSVILYVNNKHIVIDIVLTLLPKKARELLSRISSIIVFAFLLVLFYYSLPVVASYTNQTATSIEVSKFFLFASMPAALFLMIAYSVVSFAMRLRRK